LTVADLVLPILTMMLLIKLLSSLLLNMERHWCVWISLITTHWWRHR